MPRRVPERGDIYWIDPRSHGEPPQSPIQRQLAMTAPHPCPLPEGEGDEGSLRENLFEPVAGRELKNRHRFVIITPQPINALGVSMAVPVTSGGERARECGLTVAITGHDTNGVAVCNQVRTFDIEARVSAGSARFIEKLDPATSAEIVAKVVSVIDPE